MALLDWPAPLLDAAQARLAPWLPDAALVALSGMAAAVLSLELYRLLSPQRRIRELALATAQAQRALNAHRGSLGAARPLMRRLFARATTRVALVLPASLLATYPALALMVWLDTGYGHRYPAAGEVAAVVVASPFEGRLDPVAAPPRLHIDTAGHRVLDLPLPRPVPVLHKRQWWNAVIASPVGYLPPDAPIERVDVALPARQLFDTTRPGLPAWMARWQTVFFATSLVAALIHQRLRHIQ